MALRRVPGRVPGAWRHGRGWLRGTSERRHDRARDGHTGECGRRRAAKRGGRQREVKRRGFHSRVGGRRLLVMLLRWMRILRARLRMRVSAQPDRAGRPRRGRCEIRNQQLIDRLVAIVDIAAHVVVIQLDCAPAGTRCRAQIRRRQRRRLGTARTDGVQIVLCGRQRRRSGRCRCRCRCRRRYHRVRRRDGHWWREGPPVEHSAAVAAAAAAGTRSNTARGLARRNDEIAARGRRRRRRGVAAKRFKTKHTSTPESDSSTQIAEQNQWNRCHT